MQMALIHYCSNTRLMTRVTKTVSHYGYHYSLFLRIPRDYLCMCLGLHHAMVSTAKGIHEIDCIGLQKYSLLWQTCRGYSLTFCDRQW